MNPSLWRFLAVCGACQSPVSGQILTNPGGGRNDPAKYPGDLSANSREFALVEWYPKPASVEIPDSIPDSVARAFKQAAESRKAKHYDAACGMYRRTMELGLKAFSPDIEAWKLEKRIDQMAKENRITKELQDWAHELRLDGNEALHGDGEATKEVTDQMHSLCQFLLMYLYTLPKQVDAARARREG